MKLIELNLDKIYELCRKYKVKTLSVFGSILTDRFNDKSDVDLLVDFLPFDPDSLEFDYFQNYWDFHKSLVNLLGREVDLIEDGEQLNPYFRHCVYKKKQVIYG